ncbi:ABC transporter ATP-binding protein [Virgibacillus xinjiangensis]|uniref:ABC transporter ATP-binding protein n=1 Tax=Virgibacillus xinjiangensis TaxID=393090 RepID=A0ABV7CXH1_9BACI
MINIQQVTKKYGSFTALEGVDVTIDRGEFVAILGPSGCGKTTLLKLLAGFMKPTDGQIEMDGAVAASHRRLLPPEKRNIGMVFQSFALWPHMTVAAHVEFALHHHTNSKKMGKKDRDARVKDVLQMVGLEPLAQRYPAELSGGQKQRVSLARAIAALPNVLLMDEPLSALDVELRMEMRKEIQSIHRQTNASIVFVTHDQGEALAMADKVIVMNKGRIEQIASPEILYTQPETEFVAQFVGKCNLIKGVWKDDHFVPEKYPWERWGDSGVRKTLKSRGLYPVRPEQWKIDRGEGNGIMGRILFAQYQGKEVHYTVQVENEKWTVHTSADESRLQPGDHVTLSLGVSNKQEELQPAISG